ncbi:MAG: hypothetical protein ABR920_04470 [Terriglobales bacterium]
MNLNVRGTISLPTLEDANSVQVGLAEMLRLLATNQIDHRTAALMLYALQTASVNVKRTSFEPEPTRVVIDRECVERRPIGATAWSTVAGREYDDLTEEKDGEEQTDSMTRQLIELLGLEPESTGQLGEGDSGDDEKKFVEN